MFSFLPATIAGKVIPWKQLGIGLLALLLIAAPLLYLRSCDRQQVLDKQSETGALTNLGASMERLNTVEESINHVHQARDAVTNPTPVDVQRVCDKYDRNCNKGRR